MLAFNLAFNVSIKLTYNSLVLDVIVIIICCWFADTQT